MEAIILAGGKGERLQAVVSDVPKPMAPINGRPFLEYLLDYWIAQGIERFTLATGYLAKAIEARFGNQYKNKPIQYSVETEALGTGGGLMLAAKKIASSETFLVVNGDTYFEVPLKQFIEKHSSHNSDWSIALRSVKYNDRYGSIFMNSQNEIIQFTSALSDSEESLINGGVYLIKKKILSKFKWSGKMVSLEKELVPQLISQDEKIHGFVFKNQFIDIGIPKDYDAAKQMLTRRN